MTNLPIEILRQWLRYDPETGTLFWTRGKPGARRHRIAGHLRKDGYRIVCVEGKDMLAHRIIWAMIFGRWPDLEIDHIDGDPSNNRLGNLRECSHAQNLINRKRDVRNKSGFRGVLRLPSGRWRARIGVMGKGVHLGCFDTSEQAHQAVISAWEARRPGFVRSAV